jgi:hypothetical protein
MLLPNAQTLLAQNDKTTNYNSEDKQNQKIFTPGPTNVKHFGRLEITFLISMINQICQSLRLLSLYGISSNHRDIQSKK